MPTAFVASTGLEFGRARRLMDLSLRQVAGELGVSQSTVARWEADARPLREQRILNWSEALECAEMARVAAVRRATTARRYNRNQRQREA
jgi:transcriptional regulator with XRE-family HTH domain